MEDGRLVLGRSGPFTVNVSRTGMVLAKLKSNLKRASVKDGIHGIYSEKAEIRVLSWNMPGSLPPYCLPPYSSYYTFLMYI